MTEIKLPIPPEQISTGHTAGEGDPTSYHGSIAITSASGSVVLPPPGSILPPRKPKKLCDAYILWFPLGLLGFHHFYLRRHAWGVAYLFSLGLLGIGWLIDGCRMSCLVKQTNERLQRERDPHRPPVDESLKQKNLGDAYVLCLSPITGLLGFHNYFLGRIGFGLLYTFSLGCFGLGWIYDIFRLSCLVKRVNREKLQGKDGLKHLDDAYVCIFPLFGILGLHHYYLGRPCWGLLYTFTLGCLGIGWIVDWFRLPSIVSDRNRQILEEQQQQATVVTDPNLSAPPSFVITENTSMVHPGQYPQAPGYGAPAMPIPSYMGYPGDHPPSYDIATQNFPSNPPMQNLYPAPQPNAVVGQNDSADSAKASDQQNAANTKAEEKEVKPK